MIEPFGKRLRKYMGEARMMPRDLARAADIGENTVYRYLSGERGNPGAKSLAALAKALAVTADELLGLEPPQQEPETYAVGMEPVNEFVLVPLIAAASADNGTFAEDDIESMHLVPKGLLPHGYEDACFLTEARGESMTDVGITEGDELLVCKTLPLADGDVAILNVDAEVVVKQVFRRDERLLVVSHNPDFAPRELDEAVLIGVVMWYRRRLKR